MLSLADYSKLIDSLVWKAELSGRERSPEAALREGLLLPDDTAGIDNTAGEQLQPRSLPLWVRLPRTSSRNIRSVLLQTPGLG